jgi:hypothetical protein
MAEYQMAEDDVPAEVSRALIDKAGPENVHWSPRPDVPGGGVFVVSDDAAVAHVAQVRAEARRAEAERIAAAQAAAEERDAKADETGMTPNELGFSANAGTDPGSRGEAERNAEVTGDAEPTEPAEGDEEPAVDDPATADDEAAMTPAQRRAARRAKAAADKPSE